MIVADVNLIAYFWLPGEQVDVAEAVCRKDSEWVAPYLWRSEFRNVLTRYLRRDLITQETAYRYLAGAESQVKTYFIQSAQVMGVVQRSTCSAYDCEYVALAENLGVKLVTADKQIYRQFPKIAISLKEFTA